MKTQEVFSDMYRMDHDEAFELVCSLVDDYRAIISAYNRLKELRTL